MLQRDRSSRAPLRRLVDPSRRRCFLPCLARLGRRLCRDEWLCTVADALDGGDEIRGLDRVGIVGDGGALGGEIDACRVHAGRARGVRLVQDIDAVFVVLDHLANAAQVPLDIVQALEHDLLISLHVLHLSHTPCVGVYG